MMRIWIAPLNERPVKDYFIPYWGSTEIGARAGLHDPNKQ